MESRPINMSEIKNFIFAGKSIFTIINEKSGRRFTFKIVKHEKEEFYFVYLLTGPNNMSDYSYMGMIWNRIFKRTTKSKIAEESTSFKTFTWLLSNIDNLDKYPQVKVYHEGRCGKCGLRLTTDTSIKSGFGPKCTKLIKKI